MRADLEHIHEIETLSRPGPVPAGRDPVVLESWRRCLDKHGLDPAARAEAYILPDPALRLHREKSADLIATARSGIDALYRLVAGQDYVLLLSDAAGVTVEYLGADTHKQELRRSGLYLGAEWSEARAGTCALGACIETGEALIVHLSDHFDVTHGHLSCTAAPIYDSRGALAAVLDLSLLAPSAPRASQHLALNLVRQTARRIELSNLMAESRRDWVLRLSGSPDFLDIDPEAAITLDGGGRVIGMTNGGARLIGRTLGLDWRDGEALLGRHLSEVFEVAPETLGSFTRDRVARDRLIETRDGYRLFAHAIEPRPVPLFRPARSPAAPPLAPALAALTSPDPGVKTVIEQAASLAPGSLPLLIEGETGTGKTTLAKAIHDAARRGPLVVVACETLAENEAEVLFGHGAGRSKAPGLIDAAEGGTLLLDTIDEMPPRLLARLLPLLSEGHYRPIGALRERVSGARIIATSPAPDRLRPEFAHRMTRLSLPPLHRRSDTIGIATKVFGAAFGGTVTFEPEALRLIASYRWPGNLHEMRSLAAATARLRGAGQPLCLGPADLAALVPDEPTSPVGALEVLRHLLHDLDWNVSAVARRLGVDRSTVHRQIRRHGLHRRT